MGIGLKDRSWTAITGKWSDEQHCQKSHEVECCKKHKWNLFGEKFTGNLSTENIITSEMAEKFIEAHCSKKGPDGKILPSTARGRKRQERLHGKK